MQINWKFCSTYADAKDYSGIIYLHEWDGKPFYWGKAHKSHFGGHKRKIGGLHASGRYNSGYRHWIEGCLQHGAKLYVGKLDDKDLSRIDEVENYLIHTYGSMMPQKKHAPRRNLDLEHKGYVPIVLLASNESPQI